jgi:hypothetical protein
LIRSYIIEIKAHKSKPINENDPNFFEQDLSNEGTSSSTGAIYNEAQAGMLTINDGDDDESSVSSRSSTQSQTNIDASEA